MNKTVGIVINSLQRRLRNIIILNGYKTSQDLKTSVV